MPTRTRAAVVAALIVVVSSLAVPVAATSGQLGAITIGGDAVVQTDTNETYLWLSEPFTLNSSFATADRGVYEFCVVAQNESNQSRRLDCHSQSIKGNETSPVSFSFANVSDTDISGRTNLTLTVAESFNNSGFTVNRSTTVYFIEKTGDYDGDRLENQAEVKRGTNLNLTDTDGDGLQDGPEVLEYNTSPTASDTDEDGLSDSAELQQGTDPRHSDTDGDGLSDGQEDELGTDPKKTDTDDDGVSDFEEVRGETNPQRADTDGDGMSDGAELRNGTSPVDDTADTDDDGIPDIEEAKGGTNPSLADTDGDFLSDKTERTLGTDPTDPATTLVIGAGLGLLVVAVVGSIRLFGPDDLSEWLPSPERTSVPVDVSGKGVEDESADQNVAGEGDGGDEGSLESDPDDATGGSHTDRLPFDLSDPLTDEDEVLKLLHEADGRLRQSEINNATDWSKSKVSRLLSSMEEEGSIRKITLGRENLVTLADRVPESAESPFENEGRSEKSNGKGRRRDSEKSPSGPSGSNLADEDE